MAQETDDEILVMTWIKVWIHEHFEDLLTL